MAERDTSGKVEGEDVGSEPTSGDHYATARPEEVGQGPVVLPTSPGLILEGDAVKMDFGKGSPVGDPMEATVTVQVDGQEGVREVPNRAQVGDRVWPGRLPGTKDDSGGGGGGESPSETAERLGLGRKVAFSIPEWDERLERLERRLLDDENWRAAIDGRFKEVDQRLQGHKEFAQSQQDALDSIREKLMDLYDGKHTHRRRMEKIEREMETYRLIEQRISGSLDVLQRFVVTGGESVEERALRCSMEYFREDRVQPEVVLDAARAFLAFLRNQEIP